MKEQSGKQCGKTGFRDEPERGGPGEHAGQHRGQSIMPAGPLVESSFGVRSCQARSVNVQMSLGVCTQSNLSPSNYCL